MDKTYKKVIAHNRKASFNYFLEEKIEAGIILRGSEVKSLRINGCNIAESHADLMENQIYIFNMNIPKYENANKFSNYETKMPRKLLLHKKEIRKLIGKVKQKGYTLVPLTIYFNHKNMVKIEIALAKGKKLYDKREDLKQKDWNRNQQRVLRDKE
jgi:SsrA-binding protein